MLHDQVEGPPHLSLSLKPGAGALHETRKKLVTGRRMYFQSSASTTPQLGKTFSREQRCSWVASTSEGREVQVACSVGSQEVFVWSSCVSVCGGRVDRQLALWRLSGSTSGPELATRPKGTLAVSSISFKQLL